MADIIYRGWTIHYEDWSRTYEAFAPNYEPTWRGGENGWEDDCDHRLSATTLRGVYVIGEDWKIVAHVTQDGIPLPVDYEEEGDAHSIKRQAEAIAANIVSKTRAAEAAEPVGC